MPAVFRLLLLVLIVLSWPTLSFAQVDLNSADAKTLAVAMTGIGLVKAEAIVAYRQANGPFRSLDELANVKGIGIKTIDANRSAIVIVDRRDGAGVGGGSAARPFAER